MNKNGAKNIIRATFLLGGVQMISALIGLCRSKITAVMIGAAGMGVLGLMMSAMDVIAPLTNLGIFSSGVRDIAQAQAESEDALNQKMTVFTLLSLIVGLLGLVVVLFLSPLLSEISFGDGSYTWGFMLLSLYLFFLSIQNMSIVFLQATRQLRLYAWANITSLFIGLLFVYPVYAVWDIDGVPVLLLLSVVVGAVVSFVIARKGGLKIKIVRPLWSTVRVQGAEIVRLGLMLTLSAFLTALVAYLTNWYINQLGNIEDVGLYRGGWTLTVSYVGMIFTALGTEYYPRLSREITQREDVTDVVGGQIALSVLIILPILLVLATILPWLIRLLFSEEFLPIIPFVLASLPGILLRAASFTLGYVFLAKADGRFFILTELISLFVILTTNLLGYFWGGLVGLGIAFTTSYLFYFVMMLFVVKHRYQLSMSSYKIDLFGKRVSIVRIVFVSLLSLLILVVIGFYNGYPVASYIGGGITLGASIISFSYLKKGWRA